MFTSRAEYRMLLRQDNADQRLTEVSHSLGLASDERLAACDQKYKQSEGLISFLKSQSILPAEINPILSSKESALIKQSGKADKILSRPNIYICQTLKHAIALTHIFLQIIFLKRFKIKQKFK